MAGSSWVLGRIKEYQSLSADDLDIGAREDVFLRVANRCAQLELWLWNHEIGDAPPEDDPIWASLSRVRDRVGG